MLGIAEAGRTKLEGVLDEYSRPSSGLELRLTSIHFGVIRDHILDLRLSSVVRLEANEAGGG